MPKLWPRAECTPSAQVGVVWVPDFYAEPWTDTERASTHGESPLVALRPGEQRGDTELTFAFERRDPRF